jgi:hypothetical protein
VQWYIYLSYVGRTSRRIVVQASLGIKLDPISKITKIERASGVAQVRVLPSKGKTLSSNPSTAKKKVIKANQTRTIFRFVGNTIFN